MVGTGNRYVEKARAMHYDIDVVRSFL